MVIHGEHSDRAEAATFDNRGLSRKRTITVNASIGIDRSELAISEQTGRLVQCDFVDDSASCHTSLNERWTDAGGVGEGRDFRVVYVQAIAVR